MGFFKMLFLVLMIYFIYNLIKLVFQMKKNLDLYRRNLEARSGNSSNRDERGGRQGKDDKIIELDKNQYKVE